MCDQKTFKGYAVTEPKNWTQLEVVEFPSKKFEETDVEVAISHCGVCASDTHTISGAWGPVEAPLIVGHEIAGVAVRVGSMVKGIKVGDRVGVGAQIGSCYGCHLCTSDDEQYCAKSIFTFADRYPDGIRAQGGFATGIIAHEQFVFPIPEGLPNNLACSMFCAGLTAFSPLVRNGVGPGKRVGVIGIGGLGHYAILFAKALGAEVYAITRSRSKESDIKEMGADHIIVTEPGFHEKYRRGLDLIISTPDILDGVVLTQYLSMLDARGKFINLGVPDRPIQNLNIFSLMRNGNSFEGSKIGSKKEATMMLELAAKKGIKPWIEELPMKEVAKAIKGMEEGKARYRYVLKQDLA